MNVSPSSLHLSSTGFTDEDIATSIRSRMSEKTSAFYDAGVINSFIKTSENQFIESMGKIRKISKITDQLNYCSVKFMRATRCAGSWKRLMNPSLINLGFDSFFKQEIILLKVNIQL